MNYIEERKIHGYAFRVLNPMTMPLIRKNLFVSREFERKEFGVSKKDLLSYLKLVNDQFKITDNDVMHGYDSTVQAMDAKLKTAYNMVSNLIVLIQEQHQYTTYVKSACTIILLDGESAEDVDPDILDKKLSLVEQHQEIRAFFLSTIIALSMPLKEPSTHLKILDSLMSKGMAATEKMFYDLIQKKTV